MTRRAFIRGIGLVSAQGACAESTWNALLAGRILERNRGCELLPANASTRVSQLAIRAAREAIDQAGWGADALSNPRTAIVVGSSKGPIENWVSQLEGRSEIAPLIGVGELAFDIALNIGAGHGPRLTFAAACASGLQALIRAESLIRSNQCDRAIVIGAESSLHPIFEATFKRLGVLARPEIGCRPFDKSREGFLISEAAAAVCLEANFEEGVYIHRTALAGDPFHLTGMDPTGEPVRYLLEAIDAREADLIHAHGTGTVSADPIELAAIQAFAGVDHPVIYSHKAALGHTQGASGMISVVINALAHQHGIIPPNANTKTPIDCFGVTISAKQLHRQTRTSIAMAAGFGGTLAAVSLRSA